MKEVALLRYAGPFRLEELPFRNFVQSPVGLVPKAGNQTRMIFHLSYDFEDFKSVNHYIPHEKCTVKYHDIDHAVANTLYLLKLLQSSGIIWYSKTYLKSAFRLLPLKKKSVWWLLVIRIQHPVTGQEWYFFDKCLPFGASISCALFQHFSNALVHIHRKLTEGKVVTSYAASNYLDDFLFLAWTKFLCNELMRSFLKLCQRLRIPVSKDKTEWAVTVIVFLGVLLDGQRKILAVPEEKHIHTLNILDKLINSKEATIKELESLAGLLNFLNRAIFPGRAFTRRMYAKFTGMIELWGKHRKCEVNKKMQKYHHVRLDGEFKDDCWVWRSFLSGGNWAVCRPMVDFEVEHNSQTLNFFTDATKGKQLGFGGIYNSHWLFGQWEQGYIDQYDPSIEYLELFAVCAAVFA